ncbi:ead/Ea22-like family protein [Enterobacter cloacae complex sp. OE43NF]|uniref:ead/Ea22-like family protein n=1 Tax=Enterobacter cloacae complex sp. OE43NF TaxID=2945081 RepID=UPI0020221759|nr:ead/Ea22-like family protein [Enterobacter cloacae complex sp. OE43NF]MCL7670043.1 ead/Ea22-like family protein [Enterobacter cloacae complex sp. OE43NF]
MSNFDKRALRKAAMHAKTTDDWGCDADNFHDKATPDAVLALLDELESVQTVSAARLVAIDTTHKMFQRERDRAEKAERRIAELEAREINLPPYSFFDFKQGSQFKSGAYCHIDSVNKELSKHGIKMIAASGKGEAS